LGEIANQIGARRKEMQIVMSSALALICLQGYRFYQGFGSRDLIWLLIGVLLAAVMMWAYARRRRRWF
jgi:predicted nucleic acid-binding Zn ribbon protein